MLTSKLWDVVSDQEAVDLIKGETGSQSSNISNQLKDTDVMAEKLLRYALDQGTKDNVTVMVVAL